MRLFEITGDTEDIIYEKLRHIYFIIDVYSTTPDKSSDFETLYNNSLTELKEDLINLDYWILTSDRISKLYSEIKKIM